ncbi:MAG: hypothetical protein R2699_00510 [Acidimicrobiales bacterium]
MGMVVVVPGTVVVACTGDAIGAGAGATPEAATPAAAGQLPDAASSAAVGSSVVGA